MVKFSVQCDMCGTCVDQVFRHNNVFRGSPRPTPGTRFARRTTLQITILSVLTRYLRSQFTDPAPAVRDALKAQAQQRSAAGAQAAPKKVKRRIVKKVTAIEMGWCRAWRRAGCALRGVVG